MEFLPKMEKHKFSSISLTVQDRVILSQLLILGVFSKILFFCNFQKFLAKWRSFRLNFRILAKNANKHRLASVTLTVQDRAILSEFSMHRVSQQTTLRNLKKISLPLKMTAILNFRIFPKNAKTQICFYLLNLARSSDFVEIYDPQGIFEKNPSPPKMAAILNFRQKWKNTNLLLSP